MYQKKACEIMTVTGGLLTILFIFVTKAPDDNSNIGFMVKDESQVKPFTHPTITRETLGQHTWAMLHTMSVYYPEKPTNDETLKMDLFLKMLAEFYPCKMCGNHFMQLLLNYPTKASSRKELMNYICFLHNKVNERLKKPQFDCSKVKERWGSK